MNEDGAEVAPSASIAELLGRFPVLAPPVSVAGAAVTIVVREGADELEALLIERAVAPSDPGSGQVALPGGRVVESDTSLAATAIRELEEEVGLAYADLTGPPRFVGTAMASRFGLRVGIFAGEIAPRAASPNPRSPLEVAHVFWLPRSRLGTEQILRTETGRGPADVPASVFGGHVVWGFTRRVLREFFGFPPAEELIEATIPPRGGGRPARGTGAVAPEELRRTE